MTRAWFTSRSTVIIFSISSVVSFFALSIVVFSRGSPQKNEVFLNSLMEWTHPGYFKTNDFPNYVTGILIFASLPFAISHLYRNKQRLLRFYKNHSRLIIISGIIIAVCLTGFISYVLYSRVYLRWDAIIHTLQTKTRGKQLVRDSIFIPLSLLLYGICYFSLKLKIFLSHPDRADRRVEGFFHRSLLSKIPRLHFTSLGMTRAQKLIFDFVLLTVIFLFIFNPAYKYAYEKLGNYGGEANHQFHHTAPFIGPIHETIMGKTPLVDVYSQYGVLTVSIPAVIFSFIPLTFSGFTLYTIIIAVIYSMLFYIALRLLTGSRFWAAIGTLIYIKLVYFRWFFQNDPFVYPSSTPIRYFFDIVVFMAVYRLFHSFTRTKLIMTVSAIGVTLLYSLEIGLPLTTAMLGALGIDACIRFRSKGTFFGHLLSVSLISSTTLMSVALLVAAVTFFRSHQLPDWSLMVKPLLFFGRGFHDIPMPVIGAYFFPLSIYLVTFYVLIYNWFKRKYELFPILVFLLVYGLTSFVYYLGFNESHHLMTVIHPAIMLSMLLGSWLVKRQAYLQKLPVFHQSILAWYVISVIIFFAWKPGQLVHDISVRFQNRYTKDRSMYHYWGYTGTDFYLSDNTGTDFAQAVSAIDARIPKGQSVFILSRFDTLLFVMTHRPNAFSYSYLEYEKVYKDDVAMFIEDVIRNTSRYAFVYSENYQTVKTDNIPLVWEAIKDRYRLVEHAGVVDVYERI